jgi:hypothetical protein
MLWNAVLGEPLAQFPAFLVQVNWETKASGRGPAYAIFKVVSEKDPDIDWR